MQGQKVSGARGFVFPYAKQSRGGSLGRCSRAEMSPVHSVTVLLVHSSQLAILMPVPSSSRLAWSSAPQQNSKQEELGGAAVGLVSWRGQPFPETPEVAGIGLALT